jgi:F420H(2)-dependent quinone reductase
MPYSEHVLESTRWHREALQRPRRLAQYRGASAKAGTLAWKLNAWPRLVEIYPPYQTYIAHTDRQIPVMILEPR